VSSDDSSETDSADEQHAVIKPSVKKPAVKKRDRRPSVTPTVTMQNKVFTIRYSFIKTSVRMQSTHN